MLLKQRVDHDQWSQRERLESSNLSFWMISLFRLGLEARPLSDPDPEGAKARLENPGSNPVVWPEVLIDLVSCNHPKWCVNHLLGPFHSHLADKVSRLWDSSRLVPHFWSFFFLSRRCLFFNPSSRSMRTTRRSDVSPDSLNVPVEGRWRDTKHLNYINQHTIRDDFVTWPSSPTKVVTMQIQKMSLLSLLFHSSSRGQLATVYAQSHIRVDTDGEKESFSPEFSPFSSSSLAIWPPA